MKYILILSLLALCSCTTTPPDVPVCVEITPMRGYCINTITAKEFIVDDDNKLDGQTWWEARPVMLMFPPTSWAKLKAYIIEQCKRTKTCDKEITSWERTIQTVDKAVGSK